MKQLSHTGYIYSAQGHEINFRTQYNEINLLIDDENCIRIQDRVKRILITNELSHDCWRIYFNDAWICLLNYDAWYDHEGNPMIIYVIARGKGILHKVNCANNCYHCPTKFNSLIGKLIRKIFLSMKLIKLIE